MISVESSDPSSQAGAPVPSQNGAVEIDTTHGVADRGNFEETSGSAVDAQSFNTAQADEGPSFFPRVEVHGKERMLVISGIADESLLNIEAPNLLFEITKDPEHEGVHHVQLFPQDDSYAVNVMYNGETIEGGSFRMIPARHAPAPSGQHVAVNVNDDDYNADDEGFASEEEILEARLSNSLWRILIPFTGMSFNANEEEIMEVRRANSLWRIPIPFTGMSFEFGFTSSFGSATSQSMKRKLRKIQVRSQPRVAQTAASTNGAAPVPSVGQNALQSGQAVHVTPRRFYSSASGGDDTAPKANDTLKRRCSGQDEQLSRLATHNEENAEEFNAEEQDIEELGVDILDA